MAQQFKIQLFDKEENITSFSSLSSFKRENRGEKVGHCGTLDKFASGLMIVLIGSSTKLNPIFSSFGKKYIASLRFGEETDTLDREGKVVKTSSYIPTKDEVEKVLKTFIGKQKQTPPLYSAIHVDGKRAYQAARKEIEIEMPERDIEIKEISLISYQDGILVFSSTVSKGTYIRSLGRDIAYRLNTVGSLIKLRRTEVGPFTLSDINLDTSSLLEKTNLFGKVYFSSSHKKEIDNGTIKREWIISEEDKEKPYAYMYVDSSLYAYVENGERIKVLSRV